MFDAGMKNFLTSLIVCVSFTCVGFADEIPKSAIQFLEANCLDCHEGDSAEAGLDLTTLEKDFGSTDVEKWVRIFDRVHDNEMPPADYGEVEPDDKSEFLAASGQWLRANQKREHATQGRVRGKRLTNLQLERTLHDLLGIDIPLATLMPDEPRVNGFTTVADGQPMSHFQLAQHVDVVDVALDEAFRRALSITSDEWSRTFTARQVARRRQKRRCREPEMLNGLAVTWTSNLVFYGRLPATTARKPGWYRLTVKAKALKPPKTGTVWCTIRTGECFAGAPLMNWAGAFEAENEFKEVTVEAWLPPKHMFEIRPGDANLKKAFFRGGQVGAGEGGPQNVPGVAIESVKFQRIHKGPDDDSIRKLLFGNLESSFQKKASKRLVNSDQPKKDAAKLLTVFANRAFRRPTHPDAIAPYIEICNQALDRGEDFAVALRTGYRAILCSPRFLYFHESPGELDGYALASRVSYFLWNRMPDEQLLKLAGQGTLKEPTILKGQIERMLDDPQSQPFVKDLAAQWLDLSLIDFTEPDPRLYRGFDRVVQNSMLNETHAFLQAMLDDDLSISNLIDSEFTFLDSRLARYYGISNVDGDETRRVTLQSEDNRGGLLTQGAIMKVTANGTTTSPVIRGVWISERLLGQEIPPPPANVPAIEPDIRGAKTIREQLAKHKSDASCAACHVKMDPPGFALENFDPSGRWRDNYLKMKGRKRLPGIKVDPSSELPGGEAFQTLAEFKQLMLDRKRVIAANVVEKLLTYGTGAPISFVDREEVERCVEQTEEMDYGFRSLVVAAISSEIFRSK